jgi:hypothetical protein
MTGAGLSTGSRMDTHAFLDHWVAVIGVRIPSTGTRVVDNVEVVTASDVLVGGGSELRVGHVRVTTGVEPL